MATVNSNKELGQIGAGTSKEFWITKEFWKPVLGVLSVVERHNTATEAKTEMKKKCSSPWLPLHLTLQIYCKVGEAEEVRLVMSTLAIKGERMLSGKGVVDGYASQYYAGKYAQT